MKMPEIIYEDQELIVCCKPAGVPVQTRNLRQDDLEHMLLSCCKGHAAQTDRQKKGIPQKKHDERGIYVVHRLDQPVEGVMVFARSQRTAADLCRQFRESSADKCYLAVVEGHFSQQTAVLTDYLKKDVRANRSDLVSPETPGA